MGFDFSERLKMLRAYYDLTLDDVARSIGVSKQTIFKYENGIITNIPYDKVAALAKVYQASPAELLGWEDWQGKIADGLNQLPNEQKDPPPNGAEFGVVQTKDPPAPEGAGGSGGYETMVAVHRDGRRVEYRISKEKLDMLQPLLEGLSVEDNPDL